MFNARLKEGRTREIFQLLVSPLSYKHDHFVRRFNLKWRELRKNIDVKITLNKPCTSRVTLCDK